MTRVAGLLPILALIVLVSVTTLAGCGKGKTDWRVKSLLGGRNNVLAVSQPEEVRAFRVTETGEPADIGSFRIDGTPQTVEPAVAERLSKLFMDGATYDWMRQSREVWQPKVGLSFLRGSVKLDLLLCLETDQVIVVRDHVYVGNEDTGAVRAQLLSALRDALPDDAYVAGHTE